MLAFYLCACRCEGPHGSFESVERFKIVCRIEDRCVGADRPFLQFNPDTPKCDKGLTRINKIAQSQRKERDICVYFCDFFAFVLSDLEDSKERSRVFRTKTMNATLSLRCCIQAIRMETRDYRKTAKKFARKSTVMCEAAG